MARFAANRYRFPGVEIKARLFRQYPHGELASHVIGYIGRINTKDQERLAELEVDARTTAAPISSASRGWRRATSRSCTAPPASSRSRSTPPGAASARSRARRAGRQQHHADARHQAAGSRRSGVRRAPRRAGGDRAWHRRRARVRLKPGFDPNLFVDGIDPQSWAELNNSPDRPLNNRAIAGVYPPGSTFKPFMAMAALETRQAHFKSAINDPGYFEFGGRRFRDSKPGGHGYVDLYKSIVVSSDTFYYQLANDMGIDAIAGFMGEVRLRREERHRPGRRGASACCPRPSGSRSASASPSSRSGMPGETISIGIGQGYNAYTPIQLAVAMATLAADGDMYRPRLVSHIDNLRTGERRHIEPVLQQRIALKPENVEFVKRADGRRQQGRHRRARLRRNAEYTNGGKTGTAQVIGMKQSEKYDEKKVAERHRDHSLFIVFAPLESPKIALDGDRRERRLRRARAAPIARTVLDYYLLGKLPERR